MAEGDLVMVHGRYSGRGVPTNWIAVDILRVKDGVFVEHWDVLQDEVSEAASKSGLTHVRYCLFVLRTSLPVAVGRNPGLPRPQQPPSGERDDAAELVDALLAGLVSVRDPKVMDVITRAVASSAASRTARSQHLSAGKDVMAHELVEKT